MIIVVFQVRGYTSFASGLRHFRNFQQDLFTNDDSLADTETVGDHYMCVDFLNPFVGVSL